MRPKMPRAKSSHDPETGPKLRELLGRCHSRRHLYVTSHTEDFSPFVTSMTAPVASSWSGSHSLESATFALRTREANVPDRGGGRRSMAEARVLNDGLSTDLEPRISIRRGRSRARHSLRPHKLVVLLTDRSRAGVAKVVQVDPERLASAQCRNRRDDCYREGDRPDLERNVC